MNSISFKASLAQKSTVKFLNESSQYVDKEVSIIKIDPKLQADYNALSEIRTLWSKDVNFVNAMISDLYKYRDYEAQSLYLITEQKNNFSEVKPENVLGMVEISEYGKTKRINYIQTKPEFKNNKKLRNYKNIGKALMDFIINISKNNKLETFALQDTIEFYKKFGFKLIKQSLGYMVKQI